MFYFWIMDLALLSIPIRRTTSILLLDATQNFHSKQALCYIGEQFPLHFSLEERKKLVQFLVGHDGEGNLSVNVKMGRESHE